MNHIKLRKTIFTLFFSFLSFSVHASSTQNFYEITLSILSYAKWEAEINPPNLCVVNNPHAVIQFKSIIQQQKYNYRVIAVDTKQLMSTACQAIYFSTLSAKEEQRVLNQLSTSPTLAISSNNLECEIGSAFCLYRKKGFTSFKINLESLNSLKVKVDPRVLLLAKPVEQVS